MTFQRRGLVSEQKRPLRFSQSHHDIVLVHMPFGSLEWPSAGLGAIAAAVKQAGITCATTYPAFGFAEEISYELYSFISHTLSLKLLMFDWIFSGHVMAGADCDPLAYIDDLNRHIREFSAGKPDSPGLSPFFHDDGSLRAEPLLALRERAASFVTRTAEAILEGRPKLVGCTTTFLQYNASVSLCREIKRLDPSVVTVLGGISVEAEMGYRTMQRFGCIDLVFSGEADTLFPEVCRDLLAGDDLATLDERYPTGLLTRPFIDSPHDRPQAERRYRPVLEPSLDDLPIPDHDDYFAEFAGTPLCDAFLPPLPVESSRGCWKGAAQHCAFCGMQGGRMAYRSKNPRRILDELDELHARHGNAFFLMTDTIINMRYFTEVLPKLAETERPYAFYYEVPSKLTERQVEQLAAAKVFWIQPGIESLDDHLLKLLNKGNRAIRNIETLKYCLEHGINTRWNILYDIPGEDDDSYRRMARIVPLICHLPPPVLAPIRFDRFSPYHQQSAAYGLSLRPLPRHQFVYPFSDAELTDFAWFFENEEPQFEPLPRNPAKTGLAGRVMEWRHGMLAAPTQPQLIQEAVGDDIAIIDTRPTARAPYHRLTDETAAVYRACRTATPLPDIIRTVAASPERVADVLEALRQAGLVLDIGGDWLALATNRPFRPLPADMDVRIGPGNNGVLEPGGE